MASVYLDYNATAPLRTQAHTRMLEVLAEPLNPSSVHRFGRDAKRHLEAARKTIADCIAAWPNEITFTASGTEANATALKGVAGRRLLVSAAEHSSVLKSAEGATRIPVDDRGLLDLAALEGLLQQEGGGALVSVMLANNETGVIQPVREIAQLCRRHGALLHCDAVQAFGKIPVDFGVLGVDMMTLSAHKCGGAVGAAALVVRRELAFTPLLAGGGQELGRRAGTENVAAIASFAAAAEAGQNRDVMLALRQWLDAMEQDITEAGGVVIARQSPRLPNTSCVAMPGVSNEVQLMDFDLKGFAVSAGSACSSGRIEGSHVLAAMGVEKPLVSSAIRISAGWGTGRQELLQFAEVWKSTHARLRK
jgi:cysteine desulfurase